MTLGEKIQALRKQQGMSQEQLAAKVLVTRQAISKWELCESLPDVDNIVQLSEVFNVTTDYLLKNGVSASGTDEASGHEKPKAKPSAPVTVDSSRLRRIIQSPLAVGIIGFVASGYLSRSHSFTLLPIAFVAVFIGIVIMYVPHMQAPAETDSLLRFGRALTNTGILAIIISNFFFGWQQSNMILGYASPMAWVGLAILLFSIVRQFVRRKLAVRQAKEADVLSEVLKRERQ